MTLQELIEVSPRPVNITIKQAAEIMDVTPQFLRVALQQGRFPFGAGVEMGNWVYYVNTTRFIKYMTGDELSYSNFRVPD